MSLEILWRGYTHWTMGVLGGICFVCLGLINEILSLSESGSGLAESNIGVSLGSRLFINLFTNKERVLWPSKKLYIR